MGGEAPDDPPVTEEQRVAVGTRRRLAMARLIFAVPALFLGVLVLAGAYRMTGRPLGDGAFWFALAPIVLGFAGLAGHAIWQMKTGKSK